MFENFLHGETLEECYNAVGDICNRWLDMLEVSDLENTIFQSDVRIAITLDILALAEK